MSLHVEPDRLDRLADANLFGSEYLSNHIAKNNAGIEASKAVQELRRLAKTARAQATFSQQSVDVARYQALRSHSRDISMYMLDSLSELDCLESDAQFATSLLQGGCYQNIIPPVKRILEWNQKRCGKYPSLRDYVCSKFLWCLSSRSLTLAMLQQGDLSPDHTIYAHPEETATVRLTLKEMGQKSKLPLGTYQTIAVGILLARMLCISYYVVDDSHFEFSPVCSSSGK